MGDPQLGLRGGGVGRGSDASQAGGSPTPTEPQIEQRGVGRGSDESPTPQDLRFSNSGGGQAKIKNFAPAVTLVTMYLTPNLT